MLLSVLLLVLIFPALGGLHLSDVIDGTPVYRPVGDNVTINATELPDRYWIDTIGTRLTIASRLYGD